jgi:2',3'-cyclic-nucleotide 2'-phosphodiesterase/3'-nucleotidase
MNPRRLLHVLPILTLLLSILGPAGTVSAAETRNLVILGTSDIHGNTQNYDYFTDSIPTGSALRGLTKVYTYVKNVRASNPNTLLIDDGDTIQGTPLVYKFGVLDTVTPHPMALAMSTMGYSAATVGNHEFNYGRPFSRTFQSRATFPRSRPTSLAAATSTLQPYLIKDLGGVR